MIYKLTTKSGTEIVIRDEAALEAFTREANAGRRLITTEFGMVDVSSIDSIVIHKNLMQQAVENLRMGASKEQAERDAIGGPGPFQNLLLKSAEAKKQLT